MVDVQKREDAMLDRISELLADNARLLAENTQLKDDLMTAVEAALAR